MNAGRLRPGQFIQDVWRRSRAGVTWRDRAKLVWAQVAYTLRWRMPIFAMRGLLRVDLEMSGVRVEAPLRLDSDDWIALVQVWIEPEYAWPEIHPETILAAGGNGGFASVAMARRYAGARLAVVEPEPGNANALRRTLSLNAVEAHLVEGALTEQAANVRLHLNGVSGAHTLLGSPGDASRGAVEVPGRTVDSIMLAATNALGTPPSRETKTLHRWRCIDPGSSGRGCNRAQILLHAV